MTLDRNPRDSHAPSPGYGEAPIDASGASDLKHCLHLHLSQIDIFLS